MNRTEPVVLTINEKRADTASPALAAYTISGQYYQSPNIPQIQHEPSVRPSARITEFANRPAISLLVGRAKTKSFGCCVWVEEHGEWFGFTRHFIEGGDEVHRGPYKLTENYSHIIRQTFGLAGIGLNVLRTSPERLRELATREPEETAKLDKLTVQACECVLSAMRVPSVYWESVPLSELSKIKTFEDLMILSDTDHYNSRFGVCWVLGYLRHPQATHELLRLLGDGCANITSPTGPQSEEEEEYYVSSEAAQALVKHGYAVDQKAVFSRASEEGYPVVERYSIY